MSSGLNPFDSASPRARTASIVPGVKDEYDTKAPSVWALPFFSSLSTAMRSG